MYLPNWSRRRRLGAAAVMAVALAASGTLVATAATPPPAHVNNTVGLKRVGPIDETNGFPSWYQDTNGTRLELCLDANDPNCIMGTLPTPGQPVSFPGNFPDEAFWSVADSTIDAGGGDKALLVTGVEAAFGGAGTVAKGQQISFGRIRVRVSGLVDGADYKVTDPYGSDTFTAEAGAFKGINSTEDIGSLSPDGVFDQTMAAKSAPFLKWTAGAPAGYLGDAVTPHAVTGSPFNTNFFRVEGPAGSFTGSSELCADATLGDSKTATDDCIQSSQFTVQGKVAVHSGVQVTKAYYQNSGTGHLMDLFAYSAPGQKLIVSGTGVSQTTMREDAGGNGKYYARVFADGPPPTDLKVTNTTDSPNSVDHVEQAQFGDKVHVTSAVYSNDSHALSVTAQSGDPAATLSVQGLPGGAPTTAASGAVTWTFPNLPVPPDDVTVTSDKGGVGTDDVVITGADDPSTSVVATLLADATSVQTGQTVTLDGTSSAGTITGYAFSANPTAGATLTGTGASRTFTATTPGTYVVSMTVTGNGAGNTSTDKVTIVASDPAAPPAADAGPDQVNVVPTSTVTLDGTASKFASTFSWTQTAGPALAGANALKNATTANPSFVVPAGTSPATYTFKLTITDVNGTAASDTVAVTSDPDNVTVDSASYKRGGTEWRVRGSNQYCSANNLVSVFWNKPDGTSVLVGSTTPTLALGVCTYDFRLKNTPTALRPTAAGTVTVRSALGGEALNKAFDLL